MLIEFYILKGLSKKEYNARILKYIFGVDKNKKIPYMLHLNQQKANILFYKKAMYIDFYDNKDLKPLHKKMVQYIVTKIFDHATVAVKYPESCDWLDKIDNVEIHRYTNVKGAK